MTGKRIPPAGWLAVAAGLAGMITLGLLALEVNRWWIQWAASH